MKVVVIALIAIALLAGCSSSAVPPSTATAPTPHVETYTSAAYRFSVSYDPARFGVREREVRIADQLQLELVPKSSALADAGRENVAIVAEGEPPVSMRWFLLDWGKGKPQSALLPLHGWTIASSRWVKLNGARGEQYQATLGTTHITLYYLYTRADLYVIRATSTKLAWTKDGPSMEAIIQSFRVTN
jgi:uncharacterized protein YceK